MKPTPIFYSELDDFIASIPNVFSDDCLTHHSIESLAQAPTLLRDYLDFYQLDFFYCAQNYSIGQSDIAGFRVVEHRWQARQPNNKTLYFCHGYLDHTGLYTRIIPWCLEKGFNVHCIDFPGHGLSSGESAAIDSFDQYSEVLAHVIDRQNESRVSLIGQSTGCAIIANYCLKPGLAKREIEFEKIALMAPLVRSIGWGVLRYPFYFLKWFKHSVDRGHRDTGHDKVFNEFVQYKDPLQSDRIPIKWLVAMEEWHRSLRDHANSGLTPLKTPNVFIAQGDKDSVVDFQYNLPRLQQFFLDTEICWIKGAEHRLVNESDEFWQIVSRALNNYLT